MQFPRCKKNKSNIFHGLPCISDSPISSLHLWGGFVASHFCFPDRSTMIDYCHPKLSEYGITNMITYPPCRFACSAGRCSPSRTLKRRTSLISKPLFQEGAATCQCKRIGANNEAIASWEMIRVPGDECVGDGSKVGLHTHIEYIES